MRDQGQARLGRGQGQFGQGGCRDQVGKGDCEDWVYKGEGVAMGGATEQCTWFDHGKGGDEVVIILLDNL